MNTIHYDATLSRQLWLVFAILVSCLQYSVVYSGFVDPDTPHDFHAIKALTEGDDREYELVSVQRIN